MKTNNLRDLSAIVSPKNATYLGTWKPGTLQVMTPEIGDYVTKEHIVKNYFDAVKHNRSNIDEQFTALYGRPLYFSDKVTGTLVARIKEIMAITGKTLKEIAADFKAYMGKDCSFFRKENGKQIPVDSQRIMDAYKLIQEKQPVAAIENILYN